jgi:hypothetical protein
MNKFLALIMGIAMVLVTPTAADAAPPLSDCEFKGVTNIFAGTDDEVEIDCRRNGMRIQKVQMNTVAEYREMKRFLTEHLTPQHDHDGYPAALCKTDNGSRLVDLAYWYYPKYKGINKQERNRYTEWLLRYADRRDCRVFQEG